MEKDRKYKALKKQIFTSGDYSVVPIRFEDRYDIMKWRNEQIYHLRQHKLLTKEEQDNYFSEIVSSLFDQEKPDQILFSYLNNDVCIGYGGLVHINWRDLHAEVSFLMQTDLEARYFGFHWDTFLELIQIVAFGKLGLNKIFTYAFDVRPSLYSILENAGFLKEAILNEHCLFDNKYIAVVIHSAFADNLRLVKANSDHIEITYRWASDYEIRRYSFNQDQISYEDHSRWFLSKINSKTCHYFIAMFKGEEIGSVRIDVEGEFGTISYLLDRKVQGRGLGAILLSSIEGRVRNFDTRIKILKGYVLPENIPSVKIFERLGYTSKRVKAGKLECKKEIS
ncbi:GNAT family N-acetyltransferase [Ekhidna sp.]|uniref:GNAT family N-acetyltransferase n=1 Tax=Ekhidna sp. TaxID=2608089 RepID=UPI003518878D